MVGEVKMQVSVGGIEFQVIFREFSAELLCFCGLCILFVNLYISLNPSFKNKSTED